MNRRSLFALAVLFTLACGKKAEKPIPIQTATVTRRDVIVDATATATIEPIQIVEVKSKTASGQITRMTVEVGSYVRPGDLIVQIDTRDLTNASNQAQADFDAAQAKLTTSTAQKKRSDELFKQRIITATENETANLDFANAQAAFVRAKTGLDLAQQRLEDATVRAPVAGTVIEKTVSQGQVIQAGTSSVGGGSTILKMADLSKVRARALVNETDIGQIVKGMEATVTVDAFPDHPFRGQVEKIEPQAVVQQNVTMFPVLVSLTNEEGLLKPGMNGEAAVLVDRRANVLAIPNDAIRSVREVQTVAPLLNLNPDSVRAQLRNSMGGGMWGGGQGGGNRGQGGAPGGQGGNRGGQGRSMQSSNGEVDLAPQGFDRQGGGGGFQRVEVTDADCKKVSDALTKQPAVAKELAALREQMRNPDADRRALFPKMQELYTKLGVDARVAGACQRRESGGSGGGMGGGGMGSSSSGRGGPQGSGQSGRGDQAGRPVDAVPQAPGLRSRSRSGLVFVQKADSSWEPRVVRLGVANFDYTEVLDGLQEGERVALLSAAAMQAQRQAQNDRARQMMGGGSPLGGGAAGGGRPQGGGQPSGGQSTGGARRGN